MEKFNRINRIIFKQLQVDVRDLMDAIYGRPWLLWAGERKIELNNFFKSSQLGERLNPRLYILNWLHITHSSSLIDSKFGHIFNQSDDTAL